MTGVIGAVVGALMILFVGQEVTSIYHTVKIETLLSVSKGLSPLEPFTRKLTALRVKSHLATARKDGRNPYDSVRPVRPSK